MKLTNDLHLQSKVVCRCANQAYALKVSFTWALEAAAEHSEANEVSIVS